jgi:subtilisin family serine protease
MDVNHPDFRGRRITTRLFAPAGTSPQPTNTHGTHCIGTACGSRNPLAGPRYGIAHEAEIFAFKVFNDDPRPGARRGDVIAAMDAANRAGCRILSLSLGSASNGAIDAEYARAITRLRRAGSLTIAAAGNEGRQGFHVGSPGSSPDAVAVAAVDQNLRRADFSNLGPVDISAPGVDVISSVIGGGTRALNGTSMATPHVAGIAALWLQANPTWTADQLELGLRRSVRQLSQSANEVGFGLVQAPQ